MPSQSSWFQRFDEILDVLGGIDANHPERQAVEKPFGVGERYVRHPRR